MAVEYMVNIEKKDLHIKNKRNAMVVIDILPSETFLDVLRRSNIEVVLKLKCETEVHANKLH